MSESQKVSPQLLAIMLDVARTMHSRAYWPHFVAWWLNHKHLPHVESYKEAVQYALYAPYWPKWPIQYLGEYEMAPVKSTHEAEKRYKATLANHGTSNELIDPLYCFYE